MSGSKKWSQGTRFWIISSSGEKTGPNIVDNVLDDKILYHPQYILSSRCEISTNARLRRLPGPYPSNLDPN